MELRLQVHLSRAGVLSRRRAETAITEGRIRVNGEVVTTLGTKVDPAVDRVELDGEPVGKPQPPATLLLHKPDSVVTTLEDPQGRETVADLLEDEPLHFVPVGRLDYHTEGLLLLSTDGVLVHRLLHPRYHVPKTYLVRVRGRPSAQALDLLREGVDLEDGRTAPAIVEVRESAERETWLEIVVSEGRNRLIRRMVEAVGHEARRVVRTEFGTLDLGDLRPGQYRYLAPAELDAIYRVAGLPPKGPPPFHARVGLGKRGKGRRSRGRLPGFGRSESAGTGRTGPPPAGGGPKAEGSGGRRRIAPKGKASPPDVPPPQAESFRPEPRYAPAADEPKASSPVWRSEKAKRTGRQVMADRSAPPPRSAPSRRERPAGPQDRERAAGPGRRDRPRRADGERPQRTGGSGTGQTTDRATPPERRPSKRLSSGGEGRYRSEARSRDAGFDSNERSPGATGRRGAKGDAGRRSGPHGPGRKNAGPGRRPKDPGRKTAGPGRKAGRPGLEPDGNSRPQGEAGRQTPGGTRPKKRKGRSDDRSPP
ncbi:MAG TPA: pseudouridine synthase [Myxococcales bacterium LLY-WYZ-16_1]|nr:pseudouridine synthase [Myxococcales bacterium LLY-WYZ-16_1]